MKNKIPNDKRDITNNGTNDAIIKKYFDVRPWLYTPAREKHKRIGISSFSTASIIAVTYLEYIPVHKTNSTVSKQTSKKYVTSYPLYAKE